MQISCIAKRKTLAFAFDLPFPRRRGKHPAAIANPAPHTRTPVTPPVRTLCVRHRLVAALVCAHVLAMMALAASPRLHHWVHPDADDDDHDCAAVLCLHGGCDQVPPAVAVPGCAGLWQPLSPVTCRPIRVATVFVTSGVLEHAPPGARRSASALLLFLA